ncbi:formyltetrahydrofolate deformylase [Lewinella sp. LCG006]|uniref:formyltetrahydrofolate deformylase n=1 Tax=Lewinella sp. LCG006 TaxID=3231911 RepID=UPI0034606981
MQATAVLLIHCPDQKGIVAAVTDFLHNNDGNVISLEQHVDPNLGHFFMRVEWELSGFAISAEKIEDYFATLVGNKFGMAWQLHFTDRKPRMAIFVSKASHCFYDILQRYSSGEWQVEIPVIISNHDALGAIAERFGIDFKVFPIDKANKAEQESLEKKLIKELKVDFIVLARYMQILSDEFCASFPNQIINIHHSFLPAFKGARPYHSAYERGVKVIGATSHYVTPDLDEGPIIAQDVTHVSHRDDPTELVRKGKDIEKRVLSQAIRAQLEHKILPFGNKTIVFH